MKILLQLSGCFVTASVYASHGPTDTIPHNRVYDLNKQLVSNRDTVWEQSGICKPLKRTFLIRKFEVPASGPAAKQPFVRLHGNIQYDFLYRSLNDTPFYQQDFRQHTVKTTYNLVFRNLVPLQVTLLHRNSNSPYFRDITDLSVRFSQLDYIRSVKRQLNSVAISQLQQRYQARFRNLDSLERRMSDRYQGMQTWINSPARLSELAMESEYAYRRTALPAGAPLEEIERVAKMIPGLELPEKSWPSLGALPTTAELKKMVADKASHAADALRDSLERKYRTMVAAKRLQLSDSAVLSGSKAKIEKVKAELDSLKKELAGIRSKLTSRKKGLQDSLQLIRQEINNLRDVAAVKRYIREKKLHLPELPRNWDLFASIRTFGLGRTWVDYSELTVRNISLTGINAEINPGKLYLAAAAGKINYRFRDFIFRSAAQPRQYLTLLRAGFGKKEGNNIIATWYNGKRSLLNYTVSGPAAAATPERVMGMAVESRMQLNDNQYLVAEFAKSSYTTINTASGHPAALWSKVGDFNDHSNEAFSIRLQSSWPVAGTKFSGYYRKTGRNFQSFNLQPVNAEQEAYQLKLQQAFWKKRITAEAGLRKNDFSNPYLSPGLQTKNVFKTFQVQVRIPRYPQLLVSYAPASQLTVLDNQRLQENQYNTLSAVVTHAYKAGKTGMVTNAMYLRFYNQAQDTGFIYYNATSFSLNQFMYVGNWELQSGLVYTSQESLRVLTLEQEAAWRFRNWLSLSAGMKYNRIYGGGVCWGGTGGAMVTVKHLGVFTLRYDKSYLPGTAQNLVPVQTGNLGYYRSF